MKISPCALLFFIAVATAHTPDEIDLIRARKGKGGGKGKEPTVPLNQPRSTACTVRQLDATMLISKVRCVRHFFICLSALMMRPY
jgi:hypothetical protein